MANIANIRRFVPATHRLVILATVGLLGVACEGPLPDDDEITQQAASGTFACDQVNSEVDERGNPVPESTFEWPNCPEDTRPRVLERIRIHSGWYVDYIETQWRFEDGGSFTQRAGGGRGGAVAEMSLEPGELVVSVRGRSGKYVDALTFTTNRGRVLSAGGSGGAANISWSNKRGLQGMRGKFGWYIDRIKFW